MRQKALWLRKLSTWAGAQATAEPHVHEEQQSLVGRKAKQLGHHQQQAGNGLETRNWRKQVVAEFKAFFLGSKLNVFLALIPFSIISKYASWGDAPTFVLAMLALAPLAERLGFITEQLAMFTNDTLGGLLNASFGNATEVIIAAFALRHGYLRVVQLSLLGSVMSNLLLVLGSAFLAGGVLHPMQQFSQQNINVNCSLLLLAVAAVLLPSLLSETHTAVKGSTSELLLSRFESLLLLGLYVLYLVFQLFTHRFMYDTSPQNDTSPSKCSTTANGSLHRQISPLGPASTKSVNLELSAWRLPAKHVDWSPANAAHPSTAPGPPWQQPSASRSDVEAAQSSRRDSSNDDNDNNDDDEEERVLSRVGCFVWMAVVTVLISLLSDYLVDAIKGASSMLKMPMPFLVTVVIPLVGNAAEHASAIMFAYKNRIELSIGVAVGSATQVSVLIVPFTVILAWIMGQPLDLNFNAFESSCYFISVLLCIIVVLDGHSNWLKGVLLLLTYAFVAAGFWVHKDPDLSITQVDAA